MEDERQNKRERRGDREKGGEERRNRDSWLDKRDRDSSSDMRLQEIWRDKSRDETRRDKGAEVKGKMRRNEENKLGGTRWRQGEKRQEMKMSTRLEERQEEIGIEWKWQEQGSERIMRGGTRKDETWRKKRRNRRRGLDMRGAFTPANIQGHTIYHPMSKQIYERVHTSLS